MWYASSCSGIAISTGVRSGCDSGHLDQEVLRRIEQVPDALVTFGRQRDDRAAARLRFLDVADHLLEHVVVRRDRDDRHLLVDEGDRPVLHLAGRIALGVDVRDLLQLQRALERDRVVDPAPEIQEVAPLVEPPGDLLGQRLALQRLLEQQRQLRQRFDVRPAPPPA